MNSIFWVRYVPSQMLVETADMTPAAELAHRRLCDWVWARGLCPQTDPQALQEITRVDAAEWPRVFKALQAKGWRSTRGAWRHAGVLRPLQEAQCAHAVAVGRGRKGARRRWHPSASIVEPSNPHSQLQLKRQLQLKKELQVQSTALSGKTDERLTCSSSPPEMGADGENDFLEELMLALERYDKAKARRELATWGGWWRNRYRENAAKARRVLGELKSMILEQRIKRNPGAAAKDLWGRFP